MERNEMTGTLQLQGEKVGNVPYRGNSNRGGGEVQASKCQSMP